MSTAEFAYNNAPHESTKLSPFFVEYGWNPRMAPDVTGELDHPSLEDLFHNRAEAQEQAKAAIVVAAERAKWYFDLHKSKVPFRIGDKVLLKGRDLRVKVSSAKLAAQNYGPYEIIEQPGPVTFKLKLPRGMRVHPVFHASKFVPYHEDEIGDRQPPKPAPIEVEGHNEWEVEKILNSKVERGRIKYFVKWKGFDESDNSWEPVANVKNAKELIAEYHQQHPDAPEPRSLDDARPIDSLFNRAFNGARP
jgi:hypothetical protein